MFVLPVQSAFAVKASVLHFNDGRRPLLRSQVHWCWILVEYMMHLHEVNQLVWA